ncbi:MAG: phospholipid/cholesterol/gamma-HCH transport system substrate-binding protein [Solirubrobacteraceae bacterium]|jgi:virulence factor Mce-like protein|nr:virulence factor Mce family protein [Solirubrobacterales bacterium]MEA2216459.1 phospholipid/cholesterol/gamma-HCH transport system substrate-binding protein [Solirubrobacteraceae bacterium]
MQKRAPTLGNILVIILFTLSCFGLLMFLWGSFGGPLPLKPKGYRMTVAFPRVLALAEESNVRISGVDVGHVISVKKGEEGRTIATIEVSSKYAPIRANMHAIIRQKTLLGETYVQLIPQANSGPYLADNGRLSNSQVEPSVTLDDILKTFDPKTRADFKIWQQALAEGINGKGEQINAAFARLEPFAEHANKLVGILATQEGAVRALVKNTGVVFNALASRDHQLEGLIVNGEHTFKAASEASQAFAAAFRALPGFERNSRKALKELDLFATDASPFLEEFRTPERKLSALLSAAKPFAPQFDKFLTSLGPLTKAARTGLPALGKSLKLTEPVLENLRPVLHNLDPFLQYTGIYVREVQAFFGNLTSASAFQSSNGDLPESVSAKQHLLSTLATLNPESLAVYPGKVGTNRPNAYPLAGTYNAIPTGLPVFSTTGCSNEAPSVNGPPNETVSESLILKLIHFKVANRPETFSGFKATGNPTTEKELAEAEGVPAGANQVPAPACTQQGPNSFNGKLSQFPHVVFEGK